jgi:hypothetical protein
MRQRAFLSFCAFYQVEAPLDPFKELGRLISERKLDEAFTMALHRSDVSIVSWLCSQVSSFTLDLSAKIHPAMYMLEQPCFRFVIVMFSCTG